MMETIMAVKASELQPLLGGNNFSLISENCKTILDVIADNYLFMPREKIEGDCSFRQVIPYCLICYDKMFLLFQRLGKQVEARLHFQFSLGAGGHINTCDNDESFQRIIENCIQREVSEEVELGIIEDLQFIGIINEQITAVSKCHIGLLY